MNNQQIFKNHLIKIAYIVSGLDISGGVAVILQHANRLIQAGYSVTLINVGTPIEKIDWFVNNAPILNVPDISTCGYFDIAIATHYSTVKFVKKIKSSRKIYFVQSDERRFNPENAEAFIECEMSYRSNNLEYMTEAIWIERWLKEEFGHDAYYVPNGLDPEIIYRANPIKEKNKIRVLLEGPIDIKWKGMEDSYLAIKDLDCEIWIVSSCGKPKKEWKYDRFFYRVPLIEMKEIYSSCDIFLKMSRVEGFFGPPMEAMACGCAVVVGKVTGYDEYIVNNYNALVVEQGDTEGAKRAVQRLIDDNKLKEELIANGFKTSLEWNWSNSISLLEKVIKKEEIKKYYTENFPQKYEYDKIIKDILFNLLVKNFDPRKIKKINLTNLNILLKKSLFILKNEGLKSLVKKIINKIIK